MLTMTYNYTGYVVNCYYDNIGSTGAVLSCTSSVDWQWVGSSLIPTIALYVVFFIFLFFVSKIFYNFLLGVFDFIFQFFFPRKFKS